ncbi:MAG: phenylalanine--tRNA ligase subunit beta [Spirochaetales bacterium]|nr:phenylalanine--tRNA ligase subunit beta [Spirochaetales bacterium]
MKVSEQWLKDLIKTDKTAEQIADNFYLSGLEVETITKTGIGDQPVYVGEVVEVAKHPNADNLTICQFDFGNIGKRQIITNLKNMAVGQKMLVSLDGAVLVGDFKIKPTKLKGVESLGMIVGWEELNVPHKTDGAIMISSDIPNGTPYSELAAFNDKVIDIDLTANRGDCLGMIGIVREVKAQFGGEVVPMTTEYKTVSDKVSDEMSVEITTPACQRYCGAVIKNVKIEPSPIWMQLRLIKAGIRPINNIVDITNYILMECNQPLHAFDKDKIANKKIIVRGGKPGEKLTTLDDVERDILPDDIIISDCNQGHCIGGVMGGQVSEVTDETKNIFLESAFFVGKNIRRTSKRLGLKSESSFRFERTIDIENCDWALKRALYYFDLLKVGDICTGIIDVYPQKFENSKVSLTSDWINNKLGSDISADRMRTILTDLGFGVASSGSQMDITVPSWRSDVSIKEDISEEVARIYGLNNIEPTLYPSRHAALLTGIQKTEVDLRQLMYGMGCDETLNLSLVGDSLFNKMQLPDNHPYRSIVRMEDVLSEDLQGMRSALIPGMLRTLALNASRYNKSVAIFEVGNISIPTKNELPDEYLHCSVALMGDRYEKDHTNAAEKFDYYDIKGILDQVAFKFNVEMKYVPSNENFLHPYQQAKIIIGGKESGIVGKIHPLIAESFGISEDSFVCEFGVNDLLAASDSSFEFNDIPKFPSSTRDLSLVVPNEVTAEALLNAINGCGIDILRNVKIFDIYKGGTVKSGCYSISINLYYNKITSTLTDKEVEDATNKILTALKDKCKAELR